jgi:hypothetical protein
MRLDKWARQRDAEVGFFVIFVDGRSHVHENHARKKKRRVRRRKELIADAGWLQDDGLIFSNILSYTPISLAVLITHGKIFSYHHFLFEEESSARSLSNG